MMLSSISSQTCPEVLGGERHCVSQHLPVLSCVEVRDSSIAWVKEHLSSAFLEALLAGGKGTAIQSTTVPFLDLRHLRCNGLASWQDSSCAVHFNGKTDF